MKLLLDSHIDPSVAAGLLARAQIDVLAPRDWHGRASLNADDATILRVAAAESRTLVTYDRQSIPDILNEWADEGKAHAGVIFIDHRTIASQDVGSIIRSLTQLMEDLSDVEWENRIAYLRPRRK